MRPVVARGSQGSVTAEFAVLLPGVVLLLAMVALTGRAAAGQIRCVDAARAGARAAARHESAALVLAAARSAGPTGAVVQIREAGGLVRVSVRAVVPVPLPGRQALTVQADSTARLEDAGPSLPGG